MRPEQRAKVKGRYAEGKRRHWYGDVVSNKSKDGRRRGPGQSFIRFIKGSETGARLKAGKWHV